MPDFYPSPFTTNIKEHSTQASPTTFKMSDTTPILNPNPQLHAYYESIESRAGYRLVLGGTRHFGYWNHDTYQPFPLSKPLRAMEDKLAEILALPVGSRVLDAGCGIGHVALRMAKTHGLRVSAIDIVGHHINKARRNIARSGLPEGSVSVERMDYHHLETLADASFDGVYTMETLVHATDLDAVLAGFYRVLRPGGHIAMHEYEHEDVGDNSTEDIVGEMRKINEYGALPMYDGSIPGVLEDKMGRAGFTDVVVRDYSENVKPMMRLFFVLALVPYLFVRLFGLERYFINTIAGVDMFRARGRWRYLAISATKPGGVVEGEKTQ